MESRSRSVLVEVSQIKDLIKAGLISAYQITHVGVDGLRKLSVFCPKGRNTIGPNGYYIFIDRIRSVGLSQEYLTPVEMNEFIHELQAENIPSSASL